MTYRMSKTYDYGLVSVAFRQPQAASHCRWIHGYSPKFSFDFAAATLDANNWVLDFGCLRPLKQWLMDNYDHKTLVAEDDPELEFLLELARRDLASVRVLPRVGIESFAEECFWQAQRVLSAYKSTHPACSAYLDGVRVWEHPGNMAAYTRTQPHE